MTYRFDEDGNRINALSGTLQEQIKNEIVDDTQNRSVLQKTTNHRPPLYEPRNGALKKGKGKNEKFGRKGADADLSKPLRHIGLAIAAVLVIIALAATISSISQFIKKVSESHVSLAVPNQSTKDASKHKSASSIQVQKLHKLLSNAAQKAHATGNFEAEARIDECLLQEPSLKSLGGRQHLPGAPTQIEQYRRAEVDNQANVLANQIIARESASRPGKQELYARALALRGTLDARVGQTSLALKNLNKAVTIFENEKLPELSYIETLREIGWLELRTGQKAKASLIFKRVVASGGESSAENFMLKHLEN